MEKTVASTSRINICLTLYTVSILTALFTLNRLPLDFFRLPVDFNQCVYLLLTYLLLMLPFFFTGWVLSLSYAVLAQKAGLIYFAAMTGSAMGALLPALLIHRYSEIQILLLTCILPLAGGFVNKIPVKKNNSFPQPEISFKSVLLDFAGIGVIVFVAVLFVSDNTSLFSVKPFPYKSLSQTLLFPDTMTKHTHTDLRGRVDMVEGPYIRYAPGLSIKYTKALPYQQAAFRDGDDQFVFYQLDSDKNADFVRSSLSYTGYILHPSPEDVLIIQVNGGMAIPCAISAGAKNITVIEQNSYISEILKNHYQLSLINQNARAFLSLSNKRFNIIHIDNWGYSLPGSAALNQEYVFTRNAFESYLRHLKPKGVLIISRKLLLPPTDCLRLWATAYESLTAMGAPHPEHHIAILRNWDTFTLLVSTSPISDRQNIMGFAKQFNFDPVFLAGIPRDQANQFNVFDQPFHFNEISKLAAAYGSEKEKKYFKAYACDVSPQSDQRPFPNRFFKWSQITRIYQSMGSRFYTLFLSGEIIVAAVFIEALLLSVLFLVIPVLLISGKKEPRNISALIYFFCVGAGFVFVELFFIKQYTLLFGSPTISFTLVLTGILIFTGFGGFSSRRLSAPWLKYIITCLIMVLLIICFSSDFILKKRCNTRFISSMRLRCWCCCRWAS